MYNHTVSVIVPFYNRIDKVINAYTSAAKQTFTSYEIILVNDGSVEKDDLLKDIICNENIIYIKSKHNRGPSYARNIGLERATGEYLAFLDSDDQWLPNKLKIQIGIMKKNNIGFTHTSYYKIDNNKKNIIRSGLYTYKYPLPAYTCKIATPTVIVKRNILKNLKFDEQLKYMEDTLLWLQISKTTKLVGINIPLCNIYTNKISSYLNKEQYYISQQYISKKEFRNLLYIQLTHKIFYNFRYYSWFIFNVLRKRILITINTL